MDELILLDAIERYVKGEMHNEELAHFEHLRTTNAELDQLVVEHSFFLKQLHQIGDRKHLLTNLDTIHADLASQSTLPTATQAKVVGFAKYRKKLAIAATVAALVTTSMLGLKFAYNRGKQDGPYTPTGGVSVQDIKGLNDKITAVETKVNNVVKEQRPFVQSITHGTGFIVNEKGYLITNYHVIEKAKELYVYNERFGDLTAETILIDKENDLAVLKITDTAFKAFNKVPFGFKNTDLNLGQKVYTLGYSRPPDLTYNEGVVSSKAVNATVTNKQNFLLTLQVDGGNSGSPILNSQGDVIGIVSAKEKRENGFTLGIKPAALHNILNFLSTEIKAKPKTTAGVLRGLDAANQVKKVEDYIFMVKIK